MATATSAKPEVFVRKASGLVRVMSPTSAFVYPTPLIESLLALLLFVLLMKLRKFEMPEGKLFFIYLIVNGATRFLVEFIRLNPRVMPGITQAQIIAALFVLTGIIGWVMVERKARTEAR